MSAHDQGFKRSARTLPEIVCNGKVGFDSFNQAKAVVQRHQTKERPARSPYKCAHCGKWHLGSDSGRVERQKAKAFRDRKNHEFQ